MSISSVDIQEQGFGTARNGYDMQEVDVFLERVASEIDQMQEDFKTQLDEAVRKAAAEAAGKPNPEMEAEMNRMRETISKLQAQLQSSKTDEAVISEAFIAAQKSANKMKEDARLEGERYVKEAQDKASQIVGEAANERQRISDEIERLNNSRASFVEEYSKLIQHFMDDAKKVFTTKGLVNDDGSFASVAPKSYGTYPSAADEAVRPVESIPAAAPSNNETGFGEVDGVDFDID